MGARKTGAGEFEPSLHIDDTGGGFGTVGTIESPSGFGLSSVGRNSGRTWGTYGCAVGSLEVFLPSNIRVHGSGTLFSFRASFAHFPLSFIVRRFFFR